MDNISRTKMRHLGLLFFSTQWQEMSQVLQVSAWQVSLYLYIQVTFELQQANTYNSVLNHTVASPCNSKLSKGKQGATAFWGICLRFDKNAPKKKDKNSTNKERAIYQFTYISYFLEINEKYVITFLFKPKLDEHQYLFIWPLGAHNLYFF